MEENPEQSIRTELRKRLPPTNPIRHSTIRIVALSCVPRVNRARLNDDVVGYQSIHEVYVSDLIGFGFSVSMHALFKSNVIV